MKTYVKFFENLEKKLEKKIKKKGLTITVSGLSGTGKTLGAKSIAKAFKLRYVSTGFIQRKIAKEKGITLEEQVKKRKPEVDYKMDELNLRFAMEGNVVLDGRLSGWVAGDWADVRIFYDCPLKVRAERVAKRDKISVKEAKKRLKKRDKADHEKYKKLYGIDSYDKSIYHIIIDNEKLSKEEAKRLPVMLVKKHIKRIQEEDTP